MSEYQRYEFMTCDRPLTRVQLEAVNALSSHIDASSAPSRGSTASAGSRCGTNAAPISIRHSSRSAVRSSAGKPPTADYYVALT